MDAKLITSIATSVIALAKELGVTHSHPHIFASLFEKVFDHKLSEHKESQKTKDKESEERAKAKAERPVQINTNGNVTIKEVIKKETTK